MPVTGLATVSSPEGREWKPVPEDVYQVVIADITEKMGKKYKSDEDQVQYLFKFVILDEGEAKGQTISAFCSTKWFTGRGELSSSKLVTIFKAVYGFYFKDIVVSDLKAVEINDLMLDNSLIGAQIKVTVKLTDDKSNNKITDFMSIKSELALPADLELGIEVGSKKPISASTDNPKSQNDFIKGLEEEKKYLSGEQRSLKVK
jgi:hypothetical protein